MKVPLSWLKDYVDIKLPLKALMWKMTEAGLTCEASEKVEGDIVLDVEVTPNRPDWMSVVGIAREIAAITDTKLKIDPPTVKIAKIKDPLGIKIKPDYQVVPRVTSVVIRNVKVGPSPEWLQKRIKQVGLRPINNLVDITNYVLWTYGSLLHAFDYDTIKGHQMTVELTRGGEPFRSLDGIDYILPKNAIIIKDRERIIDLLPLKGGENTASYAETKNVLLHSIICDPIITRRTSQALKLRSDSSAIAERGLDPNGTVTAVNHALALILELAGGEVASEIIDHKAQEFPSWQLTLNLAKLEKVLGVKLPTSEVIDILTRLNLFPKLVKEKIVCQIPTYRGDLKIEEDLIEEVARIYGYNNFPKNLPSGSVTLQDIPYKKDSVFQRKLRTLLVACGYSETYTLSLISKDLIANANLEPNKHFRIVNPVSREYEYMRASLIPSLLLGVKLNQDDKVKLFELAKVYEGEIGKHEENYKISAVVKNGKYRGVKGVVDEILKNLNTGACNFKKTVASNTVWHPQKSAVIEKGDLQIGWVGEIHPKVLQRLEIQGTVLGFELDLVALKKLTKTQVFKELTQYPAQIEDITVKIPNGIYVAEVISTIKSTSKLVSSVSLKSIFNRNHTFRLTFLDPKKTLTDKEVEKARKAIETNLKKLLT